LPRETTCGVSYTATRLLVNGTRLAAAEAVGYRSVGIEIDKDYFRLAEVAVPELASLYPTFEGKELELDSSAYPQDAADEDQLAMVLAESRGRTARVDGEFLSHSIFNPRLILSR
jgi:hypothetical protein